MYSNSSGNTVRRCVRRNGTSGGLKDVDPTKTGQLVVELKVVTSYNQIWKLRSLLLLIVEGLQESCN
jgi:hypothetical protein